MSGFVDEEQVEALVEQLREGINTLAGAGAEGKQAGTFFCTRVEGPSHVMILDLATERNG